jgi:NADH-quinone oxidoreductase subunit F
MDIDEIRAGAELESPDLKNKAGIGIFVVSEPGDSRGARIWDACEAATKNTGLKARIIRTGSCGCYDLEPILIIESPERPAVLCNTTPDTAVHLINNFMAQDITGGTRRLSDLPAFKLQNRIALRNCGWIDPENINHYIARGGGYTGLSRALHMKRPQLVKLITSAMRGRGGPGFSTAAKIQECRESAGDKYVVCNAVDASPGASTAKLLLESDPHSVLEGMLISAYTVGASHCIICVNATFGLTERLANALEQMRKYSLLGCRILDSEFEAEIEIEEVPDPLVAVHRSELLRSIDELQAMPQLRPTYPGMKRFAAGPTAILNPETMAAISGIFLNGIGESGGTKVVTLSGSVTHGYTVEVPFGISLSTIIAIIGGGVAEGKEIKAVQLGSPAGGLIDSTGLDLQVGCAISEESHSNVGSGEILVFDTDSDAAGIAGSVMARIQDQSCGKCLLCLEGSRQISNILSDIATSKGKSRDLNLLIEIGEAMKAGCNCAFGRSAADSFLSSMKLFHKEWF